MELVHGVCFRNPQITKITDMRQPLKKLKSGLLQKMPQTVGELGKSKDVACTIQPTVQSSSSNEAVRKFLWIAVPLI